MKILVGVWVVGDGSLVLKRWHLEFNPHKYPITIFHLWTILPGFPLELRTRNILEVMENKLGILIYLDDKMIHVIDKCSTMFLVEYNIV